MRLPVLMTVTFCTIVPGYSGGPVFDFHEIPFSVLQWTPEISCICNGQTEPCQQAKPIFSILSN